MVENPKAAGKPDSTVNVVQSTWMGTISVSGTDESPQSYMLDSVPAFSELVAIPLRSAVRKKH